MGEIKYHDFDLKIEPRQADGRYRVVVQNSPLGQAAGYMRLPKTIAELRDMVDEAEQEVRGVKKVERSPHVAVQGPTEELGDLLFRGLFSGNIRDTYVGSLGRVQGKPDVGLRVKIHVDLYDPSLAELASLPWELLYKRETQDFLNLSLQTPIVRYLDVSQPAAPLALQLPLRVLVCMSSPTDCAKLELEQERALIERNLGGRKDIDLHFLTHPTPEQLQDKLSTAPFHILHYMGHGGFIENSGEGVLLLENVYGKSHRLRRNDLAMLLENNQSLQLVFLNARETARSATRVGQDAFSRMATALAMKGILAVIAMQFPITDRAATKFTAQVYCSLARGYPIDAAVAEGRKAVRLAEPGSLEWATPVLFLRAPNGKLFDVPTAAQQAVAEVQQAERPRPKQPVNLGKLYWQGRTYIKNEHWRAALDCFQRVTAEEPNFNADLPDWLAQAAERVQHEEQLSNLYATARELANEGDWETVVTIFTEIRDLEPEYADREGLLAQAYYEQALRFMNARKWTAAVERLEQVCALIPDHPLARVELEHAQQEQAKMQRIIGKDGKEMILIPAGEFTMGSEECGDDAKPVHTVHLDAYYIDRYPVTNAEYQKFVEATGHRAPEGWKGFFGKSYPKGKADHPVVGVSWEDAVAYADWAGKRLPTEAEWEKAARWIDGRRYPWGNDWDTSKCNTDESRLGNTTPVGKYSPAGDSPYGIADMAGNVWEWCADWYDGNYYQTTEASAPNPRGLASGEYRVLRGGSWNDFYRVARAADRNYITPSYRYDDFGFRCAQDVSP